jgi:phospholipase/carboxylesterase
MSAAGAERVLVLLHGRWYPASTMEDLAARLGLSDVACVAPAAPERTWYPNRFMDPLAANEPVLSESIAQVHATLDSLAADGAEPERVVLGGFSQGACVAVEAIARRPRPLAALVVLCGGLMGAGEDEIAKPPAGSLDGLPVLLTGTEQDTWIPLGRVERTAEVLGAAGARVDLRIHPPADHEVHDAEVDAFRDLLVGLPRAATR